MVLSAFATGTGSSCIFVALNCAMNIYMKWLFSPSGGNFALPWTMLTVQQLEAYLFLQPLLACTDDTGRFGWGVGRPRRDVSAADEGLGTKELFQVLAMTCLFCLNVGLNSLSLVEISITLNQTVRAFLPVGVLLFATCLEQRTYPAHSYATTLMLVAGITLTCWSSPGFELFGFGLALASTLMAALGTSLNGRLLSSGAFQGSGPDKIMRLLMLQAVPGFFIFAAVAWVTEGEELRRLLQDPSNSWPVLLGFVSISSVLALVSNLARCFLVAATSALMETFAGNAKVALLCIIDNLVFGTALHSYNYVGILLTFAGFTVHVLMQYAKREEAKDVLEEDSTVDFGEVEQESLMTWSEQGGSLPSQASTALASLGSKPSDPARAMARARWQNGLKLALLESAADTGLAAEHLAIRLGRGVLDKEEVPEPTVQERDAPGPPAPLAEEASDGAGSREGLDVLWSCCGKKLNKAKTAMPILRKTASKHFLRTYSAQLTTMGSKLTGLDIAPMMAVPEWLEENDPKEPEKPAAPQIHRELSQSETATA
eukprot:TRINITY_DN65565_c0_g1_i1.p1 TRINITY_DN65565_c0_g1~~TRINITY_DN65565_c0_g1_i1.p1  ORF type:complete len:543 (+),score=128.30 TRINITY_DN65565_c0_g1_i1:35-1663(+)